jgi:predicted transcriptional regulator
MMKYTTLRTILRLLYGKPRNISYIAKNSNFSYSGVYTNLGVLSKIGLVETKSQGRNRFVTITNKGEQVLVNLNNINKLCGNLIQ